MQPIHFKRSRFNLVLMLLGSLGFVAMSAWVMFSVSPNEAGWFKWLIGIAGVPFFGWTAVAALKIIFRDKSGLTLDADGVTDYSSGIRLGFVPWSAVTEITVKSVHKQKFVSLILDDPETYIQKLRGVPKLFARLNTMHYHTPLHISSGALVGDHEEISDTITRYYNYYKSNNESL